ncbi:lipocalin-like domain-containing protein [Halomonas korlensis]|uniref:Predicted secreted hydrolase n=1 Tax=Halomonas korlensis TaxID=463301 RepID=A0A1I7K952_9GAMM|nr:lipocalin-like domain-containing protein [Halomonas korlensis]SFU93930.1 Predicted secreted hydrolase [Halomonas korlensis]
MMTRRSWGVVAVVIAISAAAVSYFLASLRGSEPTPSAPSQGSDWVSAAAVIAAEEFDRLAGPWELALPADHGVHSEASTELWQVSAHLTDEDGLPVGVQFLLFRIGLAGPDAPPPTSSWEARELYRGHVVLIEAAGSTVVAQERFARGMAGLAGYEANLGELRLDTWSLEFPVQAVPGQWTLNTGPGDIRVELNLMPEKEPLRVDGNAFPFRGYAFSRLRAEGTLETQSGQRSVSGTAWFEHLWGELPIPGGSPVASDRLQVQLNDGSELSVVRSRRLDGAGTPTVEALLIDAEGTVVAFDDAAQLELARRWQGAEAAWPVDWELRLGDLQLSITPVMDAQEHDFMVSVWSGLVQAQGQHGDRPVSGLGTLQLTGYELMAGGAP